MSDTDILLIIAIGAALLLILGNTAQANAAFMPAFARNVRTMCDNSGCYPIN